MQVFRVAAKFSLVLVSVFSVANRASAQVTWTPNDVTFTSGNTASGTFTTNTALDGFETFSITVTRPAMAADFTATQMDAAALPNVVVFANSDFSEYVALFTPSALTNAGGIIPLVNPLPPTIESVDCPGCGVLTTNADTKLIGVNPAPTTVRLMLVGVTLLIGAWFLRRGWGSVATNS